LTAYLPPGEVSGLVSSSLGFQTPVFKTFNAGVSVVAGQVPIFVEGAEGSERRLILTGGLRPSPSLRAEGQLTYARITRASDDGEYSRTVLPRLKLEYQPTRALFFRVISEYRIEHVGALFGAISHAPLSNADGTEVGTTKSSTLRSDWLVSFEPSPGTVAFIGYGSLLDRPESLELSHRLRRQSDGFFLKLAYQFRH
ncbi:MAG: hypothetical protein U0163_01305, partial [Gemmatimonadaceae bacterium]